MWDGNWYAGHHLPGYSLLFPALGTAIGLRAAGALCVLASTALFALARSRRVRSRRALGGGCLRGRRGRRRLAGAACLRARRGARARRRRWRCGAGTRSPPAPLAVLAAAASPVAGLLLGLAAATVRDRPALAAGAAGSGSAGGGRRAAARDAVPRRRLRAVPVPLLRGHGRGHRSLRGSPCRRRSACCASAPPSTWRPACCACSCTRRSGRTSSATGCCSARRCCCARCCATVPAERAGEDRPRRGARARRDRDVGAVGPGAGNRSGGRQPARRAAPTTGRSSASSTGSAGLRSGSRCRSRARTGRPRCSRRAWRWRAAGRSSSTAATTACCSRAASAHARYREWLDREAVSYVALPDVQPDPSSAAEDRLIRSGLPYLKPVFTSAHWRVFRVQGATPLASGPGRLTELGHDTLRRCRRAPPGPFLVRVHFTRYWTVRAGDACVAHGPEGFTAVRALAPGRIEVAASFSLARALGGRLLLPTAGGQLARGEPEQAGVARQVDVLAVADDGVEGAVSPSGRACVRSRCRARRCGGRRGRRSRRRGR